jgi:hypothetical protein
LQVLHIRVHLRKLIEHEQNVGQIALSRIRYAWWLRR